MKLKAIMTVLGAFTLVTLFQNCGAVQFSPKSADSSVSKLTAVDVTGDQLIDEGRVPQAEPVEGVDSVNAQDEVVCVLDGPGNSIKLGIIDNALDGSNHAISSAVCISRSACLTKVSAKFTVKGIFPGSKGVCGHNPNLTHLSDAQLALLLK